MSHSCRYLLLTGATGMVGAQLLARLMRRHVPVLAIVRGKGDVDARNRIDSILERFESAWGQRLARPAILHGELTEPQLGLDASDVARIERSCDSVLHSAASLSFRPASESSTNEPYRTNVEGTRELLKLCELTGISKLHHVSTAYVCGTRGGRVHENDLEAGQSFANDYEQSKVQAEAMLRRARRLESLTVYRPSIVIDSHGLSPVSQDRTIYGAFSLYRTLADKFDAPEDGQWFRNLGFEGSERKNLVEAEWIADVMDGILRTPSLHGVTYHLTAPQGTSIDELEAGFRGAAKALRASHEKKMHEREKSGHGNGATRLTRRVSSAVSRPFSTPKPNRDLIDTIAAPYVKTFLPYFKDDPVFDQSHTRVACEQLGIPLQPSVGADAVSRLAQLQATHEQLTKLQAGKNGAETLRTGSKARSFWLSRVHESSTHSRTPQRNGKPPVSMNQSDSRSPAEHGWGVQLAGVNGGDWSLCPVVPPSIEEAGRVEARRVYCDSKSWDEILRGDLQIEEAIRLGRLTIEYDNETGVIARSIVEELVKAIEPFINESAATAPAITHGGDRA